MNPFISLGTLDPFLSERLRMAKAIRAHASEDAILAVHEAAMTVRRETAFLSDVMEDIDNELEDAVAAALGEPPAFGPKYSHRRQREAAIGRLRQLLEIRAKERELQEALLNSGLLSLNCRVVQEVAMAPTDTYPGMRMDLVLDWKGLEPSQVIELKRGSHLLLARRGKPTERLSRELKKAVNQLASYGHRLESDSDAAECINIRHSLQIQHPELRLVAGRRLPDGHCYDLLSLAEADIANSGLNLQIHTWDGFLAELESILD